MSSQISDELHDEDMRRALDDAREVLTRAASRPQSEKDIARKNLLRWLDKASSSPVPSH